MGHLWLNGWRINDLNVWGSYDKLSYCFFFVFWWGEAMGGGGWKGYAGLQGSTLSGFRSLQTVVCSLLGVRQQGRRNRGPGGGEEGGGGGAEESKRGAAIGEKKVGDGERGIQTGMGGEMMVDIHSKEL